MKDDPNYQFGMIELFEDLGFDCELDYLEQYSIEEQIPGICQHCGNFQDCEPDARKNVCYDCHGGHVASGLVLIGIH